MDTFRVNLMVGFLGSGKSTWARRKVVAESDVVIINRDSLRTMFLGKYGYNHKLEDLVRESTMGLVGNACCCGFSVIIDETNLTKSKRKAWLELVKEWAKIYGRKLMFNVIHCTESEGNVAYRAKDDLRGVSIQKWSSVLKTMKDQYEPPDVNEFPKGTYFETITMKGDQ